MTEAAIYVRISLDRAGDAAGVARQELECRELADRLGWTVARVFVENDVSATRGKRPEFLRLIGDLEAGLYGGVLFWHTDRAYRKLEDLGLLIGACKPHGTLIRTVMAGEIDLTTASGIMHAEILASVAKHETARMAERVRAARRQKVAAGGYVGGRRLFGYRADGLTVEPGEAELTREAVAFVLGGGSLHGVARRWNEAGVATTAGNRWGSTVVRRYLANPGICGLRRVNGELSAIVGREPIVSRDDWVALQAILGDPGRKTMLSNAIAHQGSAGAYVCGVCGAALRTGTHAAGRMYRCRESDNHVSISQARADGFVSDFMVALLSDGRTVVRRAGEDVSVLHGERDRLNAALAERVDLFDAGVLTVEQLKRSSERLKGELAAVDARIASRLSAAQLDGFSGPDVRAAWFAAPVERRVQAIRVLARVEVLPTRGSGRGYRVEDRVRITPR